MCSGVFLQTRSFRKFGFIGGLLLLMLCGTWQQVFAQSQDDFTVFFFSDNQFAEEHGFSIAEQARVVDRFLIPVARRPAVLNMFSLSVLNKVIELGSPNVLNARMFIHLGDAINNGCKSEFDSFLKVMNQESRDVRIPWFMAPGNHDSYFLGISHPEKEDRAFLTSSLDDRKYWQSLCQNMRTYDRNVLIQLRESNVYPPNAMTKRRFIDTYIENLSSFANTGSVIWSDFGTDKYTANLEVPENAPIDCVEKPGVPFLHRMCWQLFDREKEWKGFIVQEIRFSPSETNGAEQSIILIDTNDFDQPPAMVSQKVGGAGSNASMRKEQLAIVEQWLKQNKSDGVSTILAGHHHFDLLKRRSGNVISTLAIYGNRLFGDSGLSLPEVLSEPGEKFMEWADQELFQTYFSAHTHQSFEKRHAITDSAKQFQEVNIGSLVDRPIEFYRLTFGSSARAESKPYLCQRRPFAPETDEEKAKQTRAVCQSSQPANFYFLCNNRDEDGRRFREEVQRALYARIQLPNDYTSEVRGQKSHLQALGRELISYSSMFSHLQLRDDIQPVCFRHYEVLCDSSCASQNNVEKCSADQLSELEDKRQRYCRNLNDVNLNCTSEILFNPPNKPRSRFNRHEFARTNGRILNSADAVREQIHEYLSLILAASRDQNICEDKESASKFDTLCVGPDVVEIMLGRFLEAVELFVEKNSTAPMNDHKLCYALLGSDFDILRRFGFNPLDD